MSGTNQKFAVVTSDTLRRREPPAVVLFDTREAAERYCNEHLPSIRGAIGLLALETQWLEAAHLAAWT